ncbi:retrovirus-related Pol polyprotein from transposon TNT 1-94, partial [Trifolium pratense]
GCKEFVQALKAQTFKKNGGYKGKNKSKNVSQNQQKLDEKSESFKKGGGTSNSNPKKKDKSHIQCYNCQKWGHYASECRSKKAKDSDDEANLVEENSDEGKGDVTFMAAAMSEDKISSGAWFWDTGCSNHMTRHKDWLIKFDDTKKSKVKLADGRSIQAEGTGNMVIKRKNGSSAIVEKYLVCTRYGL